MPSLRHYRARLILIFCITPWLLSKFWYSKVTKIGQPETINALIGLLQNTISDVRKTVTVEQEVENLKIMSLSTMCAMADGSKQPFM